MQFNIFGIEHNPPAIQMGVDSCFGYANPVESFGLTDETKDLIELPEVQKQLLKAAEPYQCNKCDLLFFVQRSVIDMYRTSVYSEYNKAGLPKEILCRKSYYTLDRSTNPPSIVEHNNIVISTETTQIIGKQINLLQDKKKK